MAKAAFLPQRVNSLAALSLGHPGAFHTSPTAQWEKSWYTPLLFQSPNAEALLSENDWQLFRAFVRNHAETDRWIEALGKPVALAAALNWNRANLNLTIESPQLPTVSVRALSMWSTGDHYLTEESVTGSVNFMTAHWRYERIVEASHWMQLDRPDAVNPLVLGFLNEI